jgi:hypothetical protein
MKHFQSGSKPPAPYFKVATLITIRKGHSSHVPVARMWQESVSYKNPDRSSTSTAHIPLFWISIRDCMIVTGVK